MNGFLGRGSDPRRGVGTYTKKRPATLADGVSLLLFLILICSKNVFADENYVKITEDDYFRYIESNGIPDHPHGKFPNPANPNTITPQNHRFQVTLYPGLTSVIAPLERSSFGVALNGVPFDPGTAEYYHDDPGNGWRYEAISPFMNLGLDENKAHVQPNGAYHYHGLAKVLIKDGAGDHPILVGYAADGYPIYADNGYRHLEDPAYGIMEMKSSYRLKRGYRNSGPGGRYNGKFEQDWEYVAGFGDLDECNGRISITPEYPKGTYHYYITQDFPYIPRCFKGTPNISFKKQGRRPPGMQGG